MTDHRQRGFTLVELMIGIVLGLLITSTVLSVYLGASRGLAHSDRYARMQENGRYALRMLAEDIAMTDFWGRMTSTDTISTSLSPASGDCGDPVGVFDPANALLYANHHASPAVAHFTACAAIEGSRRAGTDLLMIKRVAGISTASTFIDANDVDADGDTAETITLDATNLQSGTVYLRGNSTTAALINDASSGNAPALDQQDWAYEPHLYFVRDHFETPGDGIPTLCRARLVGSSLNTVDCIVQGIEDLHIEFGIDSDADGVVNRYTSQPALAEMGSVITARVFVLARSVTADPFHDDQKAYRLGDVVIGASNDRFYRNVYSTTVTLRNPKNRSLFN